MVRWGILTATLTLWLACMTAVYLHTRPAEYKEAVPGMHAAMEGLFAEDLDPVRAWIIYVNPQSADASKDSNPWDGTSESKLIEVGWLRTILSRKNITRVEQITRAKISVPPAAEMPMLQAISPVWYFSRADISQELGLENFRSTFTLGSSLEVQSIGVREDNELRITQQVFQYGKKLLDKPVRIPVGEKGTPALELMPFQSNPEIKEKYSWHLAMLDTNIGGDAINTGPRVISMKATCTRKVRIRHEGQDKTAFEVITENGKARAWYSADGVVLKQAYNLADALEIILISIEPKKLSQRPNYEQNWHEPAP